MSSLLDTITNSISPDMARTLASNLGESPDAIKKGLQTGAASMLGAVASKTNESGFMSKVLGLVQGSGVSAMGAAAGAGGAAAPAATEAGSNFINLLFGSNRAAIESKIAQASGLLPSSGGTILATAAPLVMGTLASKLSGGLGAAGLSGMLTSEMSKLSGLIPSGLPGLHLPSLGGGATAAAAGISGAASSARAAVTKETEKAGGAWLWPVLLLGALLIGGLVWYFNRSSATVAPAATSAVDTATKAADTATAAATTAATSATDAAKGAWAALGEFFKRKLPNGVELNIPKLGVENKLIDFIESSSPVDKTTWFNFDRLLFATGSATLEPASQDQLASVAAILKAYPKVKVRIGGYTDNTGDAAANLKLSDARANTVMGELVKLGVEPARLDAKGYGVEHPVASNDTEEAGSRTAEFYACNREVIAVRLNKGVRRLAACPFFCFERKGCGYPPPRKLTITIPERALVLLVGVSGSGKSTFAKKHFRASEIVSSDHCRYLVSDDENDQTATNDAFELLHLIVRKRLARGRVTVIDATNVQESARKPLIALAAEFTVPAAAIALNLPEEICLEQGRLRTYRNVQANIVAMQFADLRRSLPNLEGEGLRPVFILDSVQAIDSAEIRVAPTSI